MFIKFPKTLHVVMDPNASSKDPDNLLAYGAIERAMPDDGPSEVAEYQLVRVRKFTKQLVEVGKKKSS